MDIKVLCSTLFCFVALCNSCRSEVSTLPAGAAQLTEDSVRTVYVADGGYSVWSTNKTGSECRCLLDSVAIDWIPVVGAYIVNEDPLCLVIEGKPDWRNVYSRIWKEGSDSLIMLPTNAGLIGITDEEGLLVMQSYDYYASGGRYNRIEVFDLDGNLVEALSPRLHPELDREIVL